MYDPLKPSKQPGLKKKEAQAALSERSPEERAAIYRCRLNNQDPEVYAALYQAKDRERISKSFPDPAETLPEEHNHKTFIEVEFPKAFTEEFAKLDALRKMDPQRWLRLYRGTYLLRDDLLKRAKKWDTIYRCLLDNQDYKAWEALYNASSNWSSEGRAIFDRASAKMRPADWRRKRAEKAAAAERAKKDISREKKADRWLRIVLPLFMQAELEENFPKLLVWERLVRILARRMGAPKPVMKYKVEKRTKKKPKRVRNGPGRAAKGPAKGLSKSL